MNPALGQGLLVAIASMVGTLIALGIVALCVAALQRFLPEPAPAPAPEQTATPAKPASPA
jgi:hypothetical protein